MKVQNSMLTDIYRARLDTPVLELVSQLPLLEQFTAPVVDEQGCLVGMVGINDIFDQLLPSYLEMDERLLEVLPESYIEEHMNRLGTLSAKDVMSTDLDVVHPEQSITYAVAVFVKRKRRQLPVIDADRKVVGVLTQKSVLRRFNTLLLTKKE